MRHRTAKLVATLAVLTASALASTPVGADEHYDDDDVDGSTFEVVLASLPDTVSPPGQEVVIQAETTVPDDELPATLYVDLPAGSTFRDDLSTGGDEDDTCVAYETEVASASESDEGASYDVVCEVTSTAAVLDIASNTPSEPGVFTTDALLVGSGGDGEVFYGEYAEGWEGEWYVPATAEDSVDTTVTLPRAGVVAGLVTEGESIRLTMEDGRDYILRVPEGVPGVIVEIRAEGGEARACGSGPCGAGFITDFVQHPVFKAEDPTNPLLTDKTFGPQPPCKGLGSCAEIFFAKDSSSTTLEPMPPCAGARGGAAGDGDAEPNPCLNQRYKQRGAIWFDVRMLSTDPVELPPLRV